MSKQKEIASIFADWLRQTIEEKRMSITVFSELAGVRAETIRKCFSDLRVPRADCLVAICEAHDLSADWLLGLKEENAR